MKFKSNRKLDNGVVGNFKQLREKIISLYKNLKLK